MWLEYGCIGFLGICSAYDYRTREIPNWIFLVFGIFGVCVRLYFCTLFMADVWAGMFFGVLFLAAGKVSKGRIGQGDGLMLVVNGLYMGIWQNMEVCLLGLLMIAVVAVLMLLLKKGSWKTELPFAPFLMAAYCFYLAMKA